MRGADTRPNHLAILAAIALFRGVVLALAALRILDHLLRDLAVLFVGDVHRAERLKFLAAVAEHFLKRCVGGREMMLPIEHGDAYRGCIEHAAPTFLARTQCRFGIAPP